MTLPRIIRNAVKCRRCGCVVESLALHELVECHCGAVAVDGGLSCLRRLGRREDREELAIWDTDGDEPAACPADQE